MRPLARMVASPARIEELTPALERAVQALSACAPPPAGGVLPPSPEGRAAIVSAAARPVILASFRRVERATRRCVRAAAPPSLIAPMGDEPITLAEGRLVLGARQRHRWARLGVLGVGAGSCVRRALDRVRPPPVGMALAVEVFVHLNGAISLGVVTDLDTAPSSRSGCVNGLPGSPFHRSLPPSTLATELAESAPRGGRSGGLSEI